MRGRSCPHGPAPAWASDTPPPPAPHTPQVVQTSGGQQLAKQYNCEFYETSAMSGEGVQTAFMDFAKEIKRRRYDNPTAGDQTAEAADKKGGIAAPGIEETPGATASGSPTCCRSTVSRRRTPGCGDGRGSGRRT